MNREEAIKLAREFIVEKLPEEQWHRDTFQYLSAIVFYGSRAKETNRPGSDIDLLFIMPLEIEEKYTTGEYSYNFKDFEINIVIRSIERIRKLAEDKNDAFQAEVFDKSEIIWQKDEEVLKLIDEIVNETKK